MINIYLHPFSAPFPDFESQLAKLPLPIQTRICRRKQKAKRETSLRGYLLLQQALQKKFGMNIEQMKFLASGKPVIEGQDIHFNISHSGNTVGVALSKSGVLGLDIEQFRKFDKVTAAFSFFSKVEQETILAADFPERKLIEFWSKKEALVKAVGGQMFDMAAQTDIRFSSTSWLDKIYFFYPIPHSFDGFIWLSSSFPSDNISVELINEL